MGLTWKAAFRFRLFLVIAVLLLAAVVGLPLLIKDDGTARGFTQILLTYTLSAITGLLGLCTLWLACGTLARDIEENQMQMVASKPIARWRVWIGKWLGLVTLNAALLALAGASVFLLLNWRAGRLPAREQEVLRNEVLVARGSAREKSFDAEIDANTEAVLQARLKANPVPGADVPLVRKQIREQVKAQYQIVAPGDAHGWEINLGSAAASQLKGRPLQLRVKFNAATASRTGTFQAWWVLGPPDKPVYRAGPMSLAPDTFHEFEIPPGLYDEKGLLTIWFLNRNETALLFPLEDGMEVLYRQGGIRGELRARPGDHPVLDVPAGGHRAGGGEFSFLPGGGVLFPGAFDDGIVERDDGERGGERNDRRGERGDGCDASVDPGSDGHSRV